MIEGREGAESVIMQPEGPIEEIDLVAELLELSREGFTGAVRFENDGLIKILYLRDGAMLAASSNDREDSIDEILLRTGKVTPEHIRRALSRRKEQESLGDALLALGFISRRELSSARRLQIVRTIRSLLRWSRGVYAVVPDYVPRRPEAAPFSAEQILVELMVTEEDRGTVERDLDGGDVVLTSGEDFETRYARLNLNEDADRIVALVDGHRTAREIAEEVPRDAFTVYKLLWGLRQIGVLQRMHEVKEVLEVWPAASASAVDSVPQSSVTTAPQENLSEEPQPVEEPGPVTQLEIDEPEGHGDLSPPIVTLPLQPDEPYGGARVQRKSPFLGVTIMILVVGLAIAAGGWLLFRTEPAPVPKRTNEPNLKLPPTPGALAAAEELARETAAAEGEAGEEISTAPVVPDALPGRREEPGRVSDSEGGSDVTRVDVPEPGGVQDDLRQRYEQMAVEWARTVPAVGYTVQFELVCQTSSITLALREGGEGVWFINHRYGDRECFRVFWGRYPDEETAKAGAESIPSRLRGAQPVVLRMDQVVER